MKRTPKNSRRRREAGYLLPAIGVAAACLLSFILAEIPAWWSPRGLVKKNASNQPVDASDFAAANQGQLKNVAIATYEEFLASIPAELGGIGPITAPVPGNVGDKGSPAWRIRQMLAQWVVLNPDGTVQRVAGKRVLAPGATAQKDFSAITQGQLKAVAAPFYDRLAEVFWSYNSGTPATWQIDPAWAKPWTDMLDDDNNHAMANLGQLKRTFSLDLRSDADADYLSNIAELLANKHRGSTPDKWTDLQDPDSDGDGQIDGYEVKNGADPTDAASMVSPSVPAAPSDVAVTINMSGGADASWTDNAINETGFIVRRHPPDGSVVELGRTGEDQAGFHISNIAPGSIGVAAYNFYGESLEKMEALPGLMKGTAPSQPKLHVTRLNRRKVKLTWSPTENIYRNTDLIYIYRSDDDGPWRRLTTNEPASSGEYLDAAPPDHRYVYTAVILRQDSFQPNGKGETFNIQTPSYAALYVTDYYLDVVIKLRAARAEDDLEDDELYTSGFISDGWTSDTAPPATEQTWLLAGRSFTRHGVINREGSYVNGMIFSRLSIPNFPAAFPFEVDHHGVNLSPDLGLTGFPFGTVVFIYSNSLGYPSAQWHGEDDYPHTGGPTTPNPFKDIITYPVGFDDATMPNALMIPAGSSNKVTYDAGLNPPSGANKEVTLAMPGHFRSNPPGPLDTDMDPAPLLTVSSAATDKTGILTASKPTAGQRKLELVRMKEPPFRPKVIAYKVQLVNGSGVPMLDAYGQAVVGTVDSNALLDAGINGIFGSQANLRFQFLAQPASLVQINYSQFAQPGTGALKVSTSALPSQGNLTGGVPEWQEPFDDAAKISGADYTLFYVSDIADDGSTSGISQKVGGNWAVIASKHLINGQTIAVPDRVLAAAHEIGHLRDLYHPFGGTEKSFFLDDNSTSFLNFPDPGVDRLMDYHGGARLIREECMRVNPQ